MVFSDFAEETNGDHSAAVAKAENNEMELNHVKCLFMGIA